MLILAQRLPSRFVQYAKDNPSHGHSRSSTAVFQLVEPRNEAACLRVRWDVCAQIREETVKKV